MKWNKIVSCMLATTMAVGVCASGTLAVDVQESILTADTFHTRIAARPIEGLEDFYSPSISNVFPSISEHTHGSSVVQFEDGELLSVWFQGDGERKANDGRIMASRKPVGQDWQTPFVIADTPGMPDVNPAVYVDENDRLWLFWYPVLANQWESSQPKYMYANKGNYESANGYTVEPKWDWQEIMYVMPGDGFVGKATSVNAGVAQYRNKGDSIKYLDETQFNSWEHKNDPTKYVKVEDRYITDSFVVELNNGYNEAKEYVTNSPLYAEDENKQNLIDLLEATRNALNPVASGKSNNWKEWNPTYRRIGWQTKNKPLEIQHNGGTRLLLPLYADQFAASIMAYSDDDGANWAYSSIISAMGDIQGATVQKADGTLRSYFRNAEPNGYIVYHESTDGGETWGGVTVEPQLKHVGGFDIIKLSTGEWVMAITQTIQEATENKDGRARLNIAVSKDEGETWVKTPLEEDMTGNSSYHYPAISQGDNGEILVSYSQDTPDRLNNIRVATFTKKTAVTTGGSNRFTAGNPVNIFAPIKDNGDAGDHTHGSSIVKLPNGEMLSVWFQGNGERDGTTTRIMGSRLPIDGTTWTTPFVMADAPGVADINPAVYVDKTGKLWMFWYPVLSAIWETSQPHFAYAEVGNYEYAEIGNKVPNWTWSDTIPIKLGLNTGGVVNPDTDELVKDVKAGYEAMDDYMFRDVYTPQSGDDIREIYEDKDSGAGVNRVIREAGIQGSRASVMKKIGGDPDAQSFTPTVADKIHPINGKIQRSGYPLLRRIGWQTKDKPLEITLRAGATRSDGKTATGTETRMMVPLYSDGIGMSMMAITDDGGKTWMMSKPMIGASNIQASMVQRTNGDIVAYMRDNGPPPQRVQYAISTDDGYTWSVGKDRQDLFDYGIGHDLTKLPTGEWVFVSNGNQDGRYTLSVALSEDEGKTWKHRRHLEMDTRDGAGDYHYPAVMTDAEGNIHISYTVDYKGADGNLNGSNHIKYAKVTKEWIKAGDFTDVDTTNKAVFSYELQEMDVQIPQGFDAEKEADGKFKMSEVEKIIAMLPTTVKGYLTYNNHGEAGLAMAAPEYVEIPVTVDKEMFRNLFTDKNVSIADGKVAFTVDTENLPQGITAAMLPKKVPSIYRLAIHE